MKNKQAQVLWEYSWQDTYDFLPAQERVYTYTVRIVGWSWEHDDAVRRLGALHVEELSEDCMGNPTWIVLGDVAIPAPALGALLRLAGLLPRDADLSDVHR